MSLIDFMGTMIHKNKMGWILFNILQGGRTFARRAQFNLFCKRAELFFCHVSWLISHAAFFVTYSFFYILCITNNVNAVKSYFRESIRLMRWNVSSSPLRHFLCFLVELCMYSVHQQQYQFNCYGSLVWKRQGCNSTMS